ncbi:hypothetical protein CDAR_180221 [Caerostris darwini]|uniref:Uncharacterized protein n=1 Tax=Caerostris darwini TaxID=1538125 RepID=A0AAV4PEN8_9ARAC|nr:hypothetical protein CDAR_180221 [Caerostris darwini]
MLYADTGRQLQKVLSEVPRFRNESYVTLSLLKISGKGANGQVFDGDARGLTILEIYRLPRGISSKTSISYRYLSPSSLNGSHESHHPTTESKKWDGEDRLQIYKTFCAIEDILLNVTQ